MQRRGARVKRRFRPPIRLGRLFKFDRALGVRFVAGADEAGRGCLAGPLVAAAVLFDLDAIGPGEVRALGSLNDSKQQTPEVSRGAIPGDPAPRHEGRDRVAVRAGDRRPRAPQDEPGGAPRRAREGRVRGLHLPERRLSGAATGHDQRAVVDGDAKSAAIAAASVIAKETRDRYMRRADATHPGWEFAQHVGYSTPEHREAIERLGVSPLHRLSFQSMAYQQLTM